MLCFSKNQLFVGLLKCFVLSKTLDPSFPQPLWVSSALQMATICFCNHPLRTNSGNDWLKLQCQSCGGRFCYSCGRSTHFPALCVEALEWNAADTNPAVEECQRQWTLLNELLESLRFLKNQYEYHDDPAFFELFYLHPHLPQAIVQMQDIIEICRWLSVIYRRNPLVGEALSEGYERLMNAFTALLASFPLPGDEASDLSARRFEASLAMGRVLCNLQELRIAGIAATPLQPINAAVVPFGAIQNQLEVVPPLTLLEVDGPVGEKIDVTYMALLHLESILWECTYHVL